MLSAPLVERARTTLPKDCDTWPIQRVHWLRGSSILRASPCVQSKRNKRKLEVREARALASRWPAMRGCEASRLLVLCSPFPAVCWQQGRTGLWTIELEFCPRQGWARCMKLPSSLAGWDFLPHWEIGRMEWSTVHPMPSGGWPRGLMPQRPLSCESACSRNLLRDEDYCSSAGFTPPDGD
jgi:hypothetical protein